MERSYSLLLLPSSRALPSYNTRMYLARLTQGQTTGLLLSTDPIHPHSTQLSSFINSADEEDGGEGR